MERAKVSDDSPKMVELVAGKKYAWCACGNSNKQPWCDGSHKGTKFSPKIFSVDKDEMAAICMCKQTKNPPYCDGAHIDL